MSPVSCELASSYRHPPDDDVYCLYSSSTNRILRVFWRPIVSPAKESRMTITSANTGLSDIHSPQTAVLITWTIVQPGLWVGKANGEFAGMIETRTGEGFYAMTRVAGPLGSFPTLDEAKASFTS